MTKKAWKELVNQNIEIIAKENNIKLSNLKWVAAAHDTPDHPYVQYVTVSFVFLALAVFSVFASTAFHKILIGAQKVPEIYPIRECIKSIVTVKKHRLLFLCFLGISFCLSLSSAY